MQRLIYRRKKCVSGIEHVKNASLYKGFPNHSMNISIYLKHNTYSTKSRVFISGIQNELSGDSVNTAFAQDI